MIIKDHGLSAIQNKLVYFVWRLVFIFFNLKPKIGSASNVKMNYIHFVNLSAYTTFARLKKR